MSVTDADRPGCGGFCHCTPITIAPKIEALPNKLSMVQPCSA